MTCPYCGHGKDRVVDSREGRHGEVIRRRRECLDCTRRFTTYERIEYVPHMVVKSDGRREPFDRNKVLSGLMKACEKRPVAISRLEDIADRAENLVQESEDREVRTEDIGAFVVEQLRDLDQVAYVRFASVYRHFESVSEFLLELKDLLDKRSDA